MRFVIYFNIIISIVLFISSCSDAGRILCVFPNEALSHFKAVNPLLVELANRGHEVVVVSVFHRDKPVPRLTDISVRQVVQPILGDINAEGFYQSYGIPNIVLSLSNVNKSSNNVVKIFDVPGVKKLLQSNEKFDLIITELFRTELLLGFMHIFKGTPAIAIISSHLLPWAGLRFKNPDNTAYIPLIHGEYSCVMNFWQRLHNTCLYILVTSIYYLFCVPQTDRLAKQYFGSDLPPTEDIGRNTTLILANMHHSLTGARPLMPSVIEVGGIHIQPQKEIPEDLEKFINESKHGVIYFSMGSMLRASTLPDEKRDALIEVFSKLPQRVLWKWENETMPGKPDNVKLVKWMPQRDVLAHPNIRVFISHGGLLGTTEAVHCGVPILGMPFFGDQGMNIAAIVANGAGLRLDFKELNKDVLHTALKEILDNPKYKENAKALSERFRDRPQTPLETAIYWTEYVIRHKGAPHLRSPAVDLAWYQYFLLDVIGFIIFVLIAGLTVFYYTLKTIYRLITGSSSKSNTSKTKKRKNE